MTDEIELNKERDLMDNAQYVNSIHAVWSIETDNGGLPLSVVWDETEWLREQMLKTDRPRCHYMVEGLYQKLRERNEAGSQNIVRSVMCIMMLFALRLVIANKDQEQNPNRRIISNIVRILSEKMKKDETLMKEMKELLATIDKDGDENEKDGIMIPFGLDILADDPDWSVQLKAIFATYADKADSILDYSKGDDFDELWAELADDSQFSAAMRESSLGQDFNLLLLFNVYGLLKPHFYKTRIGAQTIAKAVGANPKSKSKEKHYSKDYFSQYEIEKMNQGFKSQQLLDHVKKIILRHTK